MYSLVAAGMAFSMTRACQRGIGVSCPCRKKKPTAKGLQCQQNLDHFFKKARRVMMNKDYKRADIPEDRKHYNWRNIVTGLQVRVMESFILYVLPQSSGGPIFSLNQ